MSSYTKMSKEELLDFVRGNEYEGPISYNAYEVGVREGLIDFVGDEHIKVEGIFGANRKLYVVYSKIVTPEELEAVKGNNILSQMKLYGSSGKYKGIVDGEGKSIIQTQYYSIVQFMNDIMKIEYKGSQFGLMRLSGEIIVTPKYDRIDPLGELVFAASLDGKLGFMNLSGEEIIPFRFGWQFDFEKSDSIENTETIHLGDDLRHDKYLLSLDGTMTFLESEYVDNFDYDEWNARHAYDESRDCYHDDDLDAFEDDASNRWNID